MSSILFLGLLPFITLYIKSTYDFLNITIPDSELAKNISFVRNNLKLLSDRYTKGKNLIISHDNKQDEYFKSLFKLKSLKRWNLYYNLGVYFTRQGNIISNTHLMSIYLDKPLRFKEASYEEIYKFANDIGYLTSDILYNHLGVNNTECNNHMFNDLPSLGYLDLNTHRFKKFFTSYIDKEANLRLLHLVSMIGFVNNIYTEIFPDKNVFLFRALYSTTHNTWLSLKKIKQHFEQNKHPNINYYELEEIINKGTHLFPSDFRNCMMHYSLAPDGKPLIKKEYFNIGLPLFGLVESCFNNKSYYEHFDDIFEYSIYLERYLLQFFNIKNKKIKFNRQIKF